MKMSNTYMQTTAQHLASRGFLLTTDVDEKRDAVGTCLFVRTRYLLKRAMESIVMEALIHHTGKEAFYLEFGWHSASFLSFPLDSWKHRDDRVEFKFRPTDDTGEGLALTVWLRQQ
jgi:hypothetical protein